MNRLLMSKKMNQKTISISSISNKLHKKVKNVSPTIIKKYKENKTVKARIRKSARQLNSSEPFAENECSNKDLYENIEVNSRYTRIPKRSDSNESVIYIGTTSNTNLSNEENMPIVDLTNSIEGLKSTVSSKSLKTIFFPKRNFERENRFKKTLATTSLVTLPIIRKIIPKKLNSTTVIGKCNRISILDIPTQFLNWEDVDMNNLKQCELTQSDNEMIHWILEQENQNFELDATITSSSSGYNSSLGTGMSIEEMINVYNVSSNDFI